MSNHAEETHTYVLDPESSTEMARLLEQEFHHRTCVRHQLALLIQSSRELRRGRVRTAGRTARRRQPELPAAQPAAAQRAIDLTVGDRTGIEQLAARIAQSRGAKNG